jgi:hypothetical protein
MQPPKPSAVALPTLIIMTSVTSKSAVELFPSHRMRRLALINARPLLSLKGGKRTGEDSAEPVTKKIAIISCRVGVLFSQNVIMQLSPHWIKRSSGTGKPKLCRSQMAAT